MEIELTQNKHDNLHDNLYDNLCNSLYIKPHNLFKLKHMSNNISFLFEHDVPKEQLQSIYDKTFEEYKCRTCADNMSKMAKYSSLDGSLFLTEDMIINTDPLMEYYKSLIDLMNNAIKNNIIGIVIYNKQLVGQHKTGNYYHWYFNIETTIVRENYKAYQKYINTYINTIPSLIETLFTNMLSNEGGVDGAIASLELMDVCCKKANYGDTFLKTVLWLKKFTILYKNKYNNLPFNQIKQKDKFIILTLLLFNGNMTKGSDGYVCTNFHQANNNVIDLMKGATDEVAMIKMLESRLNPHNYLRRDPNKVLSEQVIDNAIAILGEFKNTVMTHKQLTELKDCIILNNSIAVEVDSSLYGFSKMKLETKELNDSSKPKGFAARCGSPNKANILNIKTIQELIEYINQMSLINQNTIVEIMPKGCAPITLVDSPLVNKVDDEGDRLLKVPFMWIFHNNIGGFENTTLKNTNEYKRVSHILPMWGFSNHKNVYFGIDININITGNCCFPVFLSDKYTRTLGPAFEKLNKLTPLVVPENEKLGFGIGMSAVDRDLKLMKPLQFRVDGVEITINKLY